MKTRILTLTGPSCAGKTSLAEKLVETGEVIKVVSFTSREPRESEIEGKDYYFKTLKEAEEIVFTGQDVEHNLFKGNYYGIETKELFRKSGTGKLPVVIVDPTGLLRLQADNRFDCLTVYVDSPIILLYERFLSRFRNNSSSNAQYEAHRLLSLHDEKLNWKKACNYELIFNEFSQDTESHVLNTILEYIRL